MAIGFEARTIYIWTKVHLKKNREEKRKKHTNSFLSNHAISGLATANCHVTSTTLPLNKTGNSFNMPMEERVFFPSVRSILVFDSALICSYAIQTYNLSCIIMILKTIPEHLRKTSYADIMFRS